jgi:uncharacterized cupredoxin-like copper-binding protein
MLVIKSRGGKMFKDINLLVSVTIASLAVLGISGCQAQTSNAPTPDNAVIRVTEDEWHLKPELATVPEGKVSFLVVNQGKVDHEVVILKTDKTPDKLIAQADGRKIDESASGENLGEVEVEAGETSAGTFELPPGKYVMVCNVADHYKAGMYSAFEVTAVANKPAKQSSAESKSVAPAAAPKAPEGRKDVALIKAVRPTLVSTLDALNKGDIAGAKKSFAAYDSEWNGVEVYINFRSTKLYGDLEADLQAKIQKLLDDPQSKPADIIPVVQAEIDKWDEATKLVETGPAISPLFDDVAAIRIVRAETIRDVPAALKAGDVAKAKSLLQQFRDKWPDVEDLIHERSVDAYSDIENTMAKVNTAVQKDKPDAKELSPLVDLLINRYNYGLSLVNAAARGADATKTTFSQEDVQSAAILTSITSELKASQSSWQNGKYQDAGDRARSANGKLFASVSAALKAKNADAALQKALDAYAALSDKSGDSSTVSAANKAAIEAVAIAQQWLVGQFWTNPKLQDAIKVTLQAK